ncbi:hypothetical protein NDK50_08200 [Paraburkholderia bryophila]|uniref:hypothetical protein n=1 Tax=Paraburkholderia bryophila TaxID=420952 RepID=UPI00234B7934|nr:hypothetical protein [Paraburkholderia bryophila]WCM21418.1 hypothetical protein NDK50_08200 [Paraburkholderia bryophila]
MRRYLFHRLAGRIVRRVIGVDREPIVHPDFHGADILLLAWAALFGACFSTLVLIAFFGDQFLNSICRG